MVHAPAHGTSRGKPDGEATSGGGGGGGSGSEAHTADTRSRTEIEAEETAREIAEAIGGFQVAMQPDYLEHERERHASLAFGARFDAAATASTGVAAGASTAGGHESADGSDVGGLVGAIAGSDGAPDGPVAGTAVQAEAPAQREDGLSPAALSFAPSDAYGLPGAAYGGMFHPHHHHHHHHHGGVAPLGVGEGHLRVAHELAEQQIRLQQQMAALYAGGNGSPEGVAALTEFHNEFHSREEELSFLRSLGWEEGDVGHSPES